MKKGEKILFGIVALLVLITVINFTVLETIRRNSEKPLFPILTHFVFSDEGLTWLQDISAKRLLYLPQGCR